MNGISKQKPAPNDEYTQERFNKFIQAENERLNQLIHNLYLYLLQFKNYDERDLYDNICKEVAEYFRADCCALYLIHYEADEEKRELKKWLELVGASGQWQRALRQQYSRQLHRNRYEITDPASVPSRNVTTDAFLRDIPIRYPSCYHLRDIREQRNETIRGLIWYQDGLYNSCRCSILAPLIRESRTNTIFDESQDDNFVAPHRKIGLIKVENRTPYGILGFTEAPPQGISRRLFFEEEWQLASIRPYLHDLGESEDPFHALNDKIGWNQYYEEHPAGAKYFQELSNSVKELSNPKTGQELRKKYQSLSLELEQFIEALVRFESWIQHLRYACWIVVYGIGESRLLTKSVPSLFNIYNLTAAHFIDWTVSLDTANESAPGIGTESLKEKYIYENVRENILRIISENNQTLTDNLTGKRRIFIDLRKLETLLEKLGLLIKLEEKPGVKRPKIQHLIETVKQYTWEIQNIQDPDSEYLAELMQEIEARMDIRPNANLAGAGSTPISSKIKAMERFNESIQNLQQKLKRAHDHLRDVVDREIEALCEDYAAKIRTATQIDIRSIELSHYLENSLPGELLLHHNYERGFRIIERCLRDNCREIMSSVSREPDFRESPVEETEVYQICKCVISILEKKFELQKNYGVACDNQENHDAKPSAALGCDIARALAAATMYADNFQQIDEKRLVFIASHITQLIDNHLLYQIRQRGLELDYDSLTLFQLENYGIELIDTFFSLIQQIKLGLIYLISSKINDLKFTEKLITSEELQDAFHHNTELLFIEIEFFTDQDIPKTFTEIQQTFTDGAEFIEVQILTGSNMAPEVQKRTARARLVMQYHCSMKKLVLKIPISNASSDSLGVLFDSVNLLKSLWRFMNTQLCFIKKVCSFREL
ncbi:MAG TPA: hypothetical protein VHY08_19035 [Bacillota bacterium]|nr:hypothetical protein [Bacillota bacterium]